MKKVISDHFGHIAGCDMTNGSLYIHILTSQKSYETGEIEEVMLRMPYTGDVNTIVQILDDNTSPKRVRIIIETED